MIYPTELLTKAAEIKLVIFDVDGVFTNGQLHFGPTGDEQKVFFVHDGLGIKWLLQNNIEVAIISGRTAPAVAERLSQLGVKHIYQGQENKLPAFHTLLEQLELTPAEVAYAGDDLPDVPIICSAGLGIAVKNAHAFVKQQAYWTTKNAGGLGAVREICELILAAQNKLEKIYQGYLPTHVHINQTNYR